MSLQELYIAYKNPIPNFNDKKSRWLIVIVPGLFINLFLNLFEPFGINKSEHFISYTLVMAGYGVLGSIIIYIHEFIVKRYFINLSRKKIALNKLVVWYIWITFIIAVFNFFYFSIVQQYFLGVIDAYALREFLLFLYRTYLISIIPAVGLILYFRYTEALKTKYVTKPVFLRMQTNSGESILLIAENKKDSFTVNILQLLYIQSIDNYASIFYLDETHSVHKHILRTSLRKLEDQLKGSQVIRCHQSYIVNSLLIQHVDGNSRNMQLYLKNLDTPLPVSRSYITGIRTMLSKIT